MRLPSGCGGYSVGGGDYTCYGVYGGGDGGMIQEVTGGIYANQGMPYKLTICTTCGKEFKRYAGHIYKKTHQKQGDKQTTDWFCSYTCWPAGGILNEIKQQEEIEVARERRRSEKTKEKRRPEEKVCHNCDHFREGSVGNNPPRNICLCPDIDFWQMAEHLCKGKAGCRHYMVKKRGKTGSIGTRYNKN